MHYILSHLVLFIADCNLLIPINRFKFFSNMLLYKPVNKYLTMTSHMLLCSNSPLIPIFPSEVNFKWHDGSGGVSLILTYKDLCTRP